MSLKNNDYSKLLDNIKLISKSIKIVRDENNPSNRAFACTLVNDLLIRFGRDLTEMNGQISSYDKKKLLFDIEIIEGGVRIVENENNTDNRKFACELVEKLVNKLYSDIEEMKE